jgi:hypothetical protein
MDDTNLQVDPAKVFPANIMMQPAELPLTVREAALYLGVSAQTVYLWVERKQIPLGQRLALDPQLQRVWVRGGCRTLSSQ